MFACIGILALVAVAQDGPPPGRDGRSRDDDRPDAIGQLGLSPEQIQQFRQLNREHRPLINEAQRRMREANRELDMAIYADTVSDTVVQARIKAFQDAQAEVSRLRFGHELNIRKLLTHEQLIRFREMRRRFAENLQENQRRNLRPRRNMIRQQRPATENQKRPTI